TATAVPVLAAAMGLASAAPAQAVTFPNPFASCKKAPPAQLPGSGLSGWLNGSVPNAMGARPAGGMSRGNPFAAHPGATEFQQYGYAGLTWSTYDLPTIAGGLAGCAPDPTVSIMANLDTTVGNWLLGAAKLVVGADNTVHGWAVNSSWLASLNPIVTTSEA